MKRRNLICFWALTGLLALTGCTSYEKPVKAISRSTFTGIPEEEHKRLVTPSKVLTLEEAQSLAVQNNPNFKTMYFAVIAARARYYQSFSDYLPTITGNFSIGQSFNEPRTRYAENYDTYTGKRIFTVVPSANLNWLVFDSFAREMNVLAKKHSLKASQADELDARRLLVLAVANTYNEILLANAEVRIALEDMKFQNSQLKENELKFEVGAVPLSDVLNFKAKYNAAESTLYAARYKAVAAKNTLGTLLGLTDGTLPDTVQFPEVPSTDGEILQPVNNYLDTALANRPDLKKYREALEVSKYTYWGTICNFGPQVTFKANIGYEYSRGDYKPYYDGGSNYYLRNENFTFSYGGEVSWVLLDGGSRFFNMRAAQAAMLQSDYNLAYNWISILSEVRTAYDGYHMCFRQVRIYQKSLELYRKIRDLVREEYNAGNTELTRLNEAQRDFVDAETNLATYVINMHNAKAKLAAVTGAY